MGLTTSSSLEFDILRSFKLGADHMPKCPNTKIRPALPKTQN